MRITAILTFMLALGTVANTSLAYAQDPAPAASPAVREEFNNWLETAAAFRDGTQETARLWQRDNAPLLEARTDVFVAETEAFVDMTQAYARHLRGMASGHEAAAMLREISAVVTDRLDALAAARPLGAAAVVRELNEMDHAIYEGFLTFGADEALQARMQRPVSVPIRVAYAEAGSQ